jgi:acyl carrier protein
MKQQIIEILTEIRPEFDFTQDANFIEQGMLDSFDVIMFVTALDEKFNVSIDGMDILPENFSSIEKIENLLKKSGVKK